MSRMNRRRLDALQATLGYDPEADPEVLNTRPLDTLTDEQIAIIMVANGWLRPGEDPLNLSDERLMELALGEKVN